MGRNVAELSQYTPNIRNSACSAQPTIPKHNHSVNSIPAISHQATPRYIGTHRTPKKHKTICNLLRLPHPLHRRLLDRMIMRARGPIIQIRRHRRSDEARAHGVDADALRGVHGAVGFGDAEDGVFGAAVGGCDDPEETQDGGDIYYAAAADAGAEVSVVVLGGGWNKV